MTVTEQLNSVRAYFQQQPLIFRALLAGLGFLAGEMGIREAQARLNARPLLMASSVLTAKAQAGAVVDAADLRRIAAVASSGREVAEVAGASAAGMFALKVQSDRAPVLADISPLDPVQVQEVDLEAVVRSLNVQAYTPSGATINGEYVAIGEDISAAPMITAGGKGRHVVLKRVDADAIVFLDPFKKRDIIVGM